MELKRLDEIQISFNELLNKVQLIDYQMYKEDESRKDLKSRLNWLEQKSEDNRKLVANHVTEFKKVDEDLNR